MSLALQAEIQALRKEMAELRLRVASMAQIKSPAAILEEFEQRYLADMESMTRTLELVKKRCDDLWVLRTAIASDVEATLGAPRREPIDPRKVKMPKTLMALGFRAPE